MSNRTYRVSEIVGTSTESINDAVENGIERAGDTLRHLDWFEVTEIRGNFTDEVIAHFQVTMKVGFRLDDDPVSGRVDFDPGRFEFKHQMRVLRRDGQRGIDSRSEGMY